MADLQEKPLTLRQTEEIGLYAAQGPSDCGFDSDLLDALDPDTIVEAVGDFIDRWQKHHRHPHHPVPTYAPGTLDDVAMRLACLWGIQVAEVLAWEWVQLGNQDDFYVALVSLDRAYGIYVLEWVGHFLEDKNKDNTIILVFNCLKAGKLPSSSAHSYLILW